MNTSMAFSYVLDDTTTTWVPLSGFSGGAIEPITPGGLLLNTAAFNYAWNGFGFEKIRVSKVFKYFQKPDGAAEAIWTPNGTFRLMGFTVSVSGTAAVSDNVLITLTDGLPAVDNIIWAGYAAVLDTINGDTQMGADFGQGYLSVLASNSLCANFQGNAGVFDFVTGGVSITMWGEDEG